MDRVKPTLAAYDYVEQRPQFEGTDFGTVGRVILRFKASRIVWRAGSTAWSGVGMRDYYKATLYAERVPNGLIGATNYPIVEGGRLSQKMWAQAREAIAFRLKVTIDWIPKILPTKTLVIP